MKYIKPGDQSDVDAPYQDANPGSGIDGSVVPAHAVEHPMREIVHVIVMAGITPSETVLTQLYDALLLIIAAHDASGLTTVHTELPLHGTGSTADPVAIYAATTTQFGSIQIATAPQYLANTGNNDALTPDHVWASAAYLAVPFSSTIALDLHAAFNFSIAPLTGNVTLANPTNNDLPGKEGMIVIPQDATGGRTMTLGSAWKTPGGFQGLSTVPSAIDAIAYKVVSPTLILYSLLKGCA
jgi:hypothetical protein